MKLAEQEYARDTQAIELNRYARYNDFMQQVQAESPEEYSDIPAIEARYGMLQSAIAAAEADAEEYKAQVAHETLQLSRLRGTLERHKLELQNEFDMLKQQHDAAKERADELVAAADEASAAKGDKLLEFGQVLQTVGHLHTRCMGSHHRDIIKHKHTVITDDDLVYGRVALPQRHTTDESPSTSTVQRGSSAPAASAASSDSGAPNQQLQELLLAGRRNARGGALVSEEEQQRTADFLQLKSDVVSAMQQLEVVGHYIFDFARLVSDWETRDKYTWSSGETDADAAAGPTAGLTSPMRATGARRASGAGGAVSGSRSMAASSLGMSKAGGASTRHRGAAGSGHEVSGSGHHAGHSGGVEWQLKRPGLGESSAMVGSSSRVGQSHSTH